MSTAVAEPAVAPPAATPAPVAQPIFKDGELVRIRRASAYLPTLLFGDTVQVVVITPDAFRFVSIMDPRRQCRVDASTVSILKSEGSISIGDLPVAFDPCAVTLPLRVYTTCKLRFSDSLEIPRNCELMLNESGVWNYKTGTRFGLLIGSSERVRRMLSYCSVKIEPSGDVLSADLDDALTMHLPNRLLDMIDSCVREAVEQAPKSPIVRGLLRNIVRRPIPPEADTAEHIIEWIRKIPLFPATDPDWTPNLAASRAAASLPTEPVPAAPTLNVPPAEPTVVLSGLRIERLVTGNVSWSRTDTYRGDMNIPVRIAQEGEEAIREYVMENYRDELSEDIGDESVNWDSVRDQGTESEEIERGETAIEDMASNHNPDNDRDDDIDDDE